MFIPQTTGNLLGLNEDENPHFLQEGELTKADNTMRIGNMVGTRYGTSRPGSAEDYENQIDEGNEIKGLYEFRKDFDTGRQLISIAEHTDAGASPLASVFYEDNARLPNGPTITAGAGNFWTFAAHNNLLWGAGGGSSDDIWTWDGDTGTAPVARALVDTLSGDRLRPQYVFQFRNYMLLSGFRTGNPSNTVNPMIARYATFASDPTLPASWPDGNSIGFSAVRAGLEAYGPSYSTGFAKFQSNEGVFLLLLANNQITTVALDATNDFAVQDAIANGCVGQNAFVPLGIDSGDAIFWSNKGIHSIRQAQQFGGRADTFLSWKIRPTFASLNRSRFDQVVGAYDEVNGYVIFAAATGSNTTNDLLLVLDVKDLDTITADNARWYKWRLSGSLRISSMRFGRSSSGERRLYFGTTNGDVGYINAATFSDFDSSTSAATAYTVEFQTRHKADFEGANVFSNSPSLLNRKDLGDIMVTLQPGGAYTPTMKFVFDYGERTSGGRPLTMAAAGGAQVGVGLVGTATVGADSATRDEKVYGTGGGRTIAFNFSHAGANQPFRVGRVDYEVDTGSSDAGSNAA